MGDMVNKKNWTSAEDEFLRENAEKYTLATLSKKLNRSTDGIRYRARKLGVKRIKSVRESWNKNANSNTIWTEEENTYLKESWGKADLNRLSKVLKRSKSAIKYRIFKLGLGSFKDNSNYFTFGELTRAFTQSPNTSLYGHHYRRWTKAGLKIKDRQVNNSVIRMVLKAHFWEFAEEHKDLFEWSYLKRDVLDKEPDWVEQERIEALKPKKYFRQNKYWSDRETNLLISKVKHQRFTYDELSEEFGRSPASILARLERLGVKNRPLTRRD